MDNTGTSGAQIHLSFTMTHPTVPIMTVIFIVLNVNIHE